MDFFSNLTTALNNPDTQSRISDFMAANPPKPTQSETTQKLADQIKAQGMMGNWSTGSGFSKDQAAAYMADKLVRQGGITRLEDFGQFEKTYTVPVEQKDYISYPNEDGSSYTVEAWRAGIGRDKEGNLGRWRAEGYGDFLEPLDAVTKNQIITKQGYSVGDGEGNDTFIPLTPEQIKTVKNGSIEFPYGKAYGNKITKQEIPMEYSRAKAGDWGGTFEGDSSTGFGVQFNELGMPIFYAHYDTDNSWMGPLGMALTVGSFIPGVAPFAMALNAGLQASQGNTIGAVLSALNSAAGFAGRGLEAVNGMDLASDIATLGYNPASLLSGIQNAQQAVGVMNAVSKGNLAGIIGSLTNLAPQIGVTIPEDIMKPVQMAALGSAVSRGDWAGAMQAAGTLTNSSDLKLANKALNVVKAVESGNPSSILASTVGFVNQAGLDKSIVKDAFATYGVGATDQQVDSIAQSNNPYNEIESAFGLDKAFLERKEAGYQQYMGSGSSDFGASGNFSDSSAGGFFAESPDLRPADVVDQLTDSGLTNAGTSGSPDIGATPEEPKSLDDILGTVGITSPAPDTTAPPSNQEILDVIGYTPEKPIDVVDQLTNAGLTTEEPTLPITPVEPETPVEPAPVVTPPAAPTGYFDEITGHWIDTSTGKDIDTGSSTGGNIDESKSGNVNNMKDWAFDSGSGKWAWTDPATGETTNYEYATPITGGPMTGKEIMDKAGAGPSGGTAPKVPATPVKPTTPTTPKTPVATPSSASNILPLLEALSQPAVQQQTATQDPYAHIKSYEELFGHELFGPSTAPASSAYKQFSDGGHVDDFSVDALLHILRS